MATVPSPRTWTSSELVTAAKLNTDIRDAFNFLMAPPRCVLRKSGQQTISSGVLTAVTWDTELIDSDGGHSTVTNNSRYVAQTAGWYHLIASMVFYQPTDVGFYETFFIKNADGSTRQSRSDVHAMSTDIVVVSTSGYMSLAVNDYVEAHVYQSSGADRSLESGNGSAIFPSSFEIRWVRA